MLAFAFTGVGFVAVRNVAEIDFTAELPTDPASLFVIVLALLAVGAVVRFGRR